MIKLDIYHTNWGEAVFVYAEPGGRVNLRIGRCRISSGYSISRMFRAPEVAGWPGGYAQRYNIDIGRNPSCGIVAGETLKPLIQCFGRDERVVVNEFDAALTHAKTDLPLSAAILEQRKFLGVEVLYVAGYPLLRISKQTHFGRNFDPDVVAPMLVSWAGQLPAYSPIRLCVRSAAGQQSIVALPRDAMTQIGRSVRIYNAHYSGGRDSGILRMYTKAVPVGRRDYPVGGNDEETGINPTGGGGTTAP